MRLQFLTSSRDKVKKEVRRTRFFRIYNNPNQAIYLAKNCHIFSVSSIQELTVVCNIHVIN